MGCCGMPQVLGDSEGDPLKNMKENENPAPNLSKIPKKNENFINLQNQIKNENPISLQNQKGDENSLNLEKPNNNENCEKKEISDIIFNFIKICLMSLANKIKYI